MQKKKKTRIFNTVLEESKPVNFSGDSFFTVTRLFRHTYNVRLTAIYTLRGTFFFFFILEISDSFSNFQPQNVMIFCPARRSVRSWKLRDSKRARFDRVGENHRQFSPTERAGKRSLILNNTRGRTKPFKSITIDGRKRKKIHPENAQINSVRKSDVQTLWTDIPGTFSPVFSRGFLPPPHPTPISSLSQSPKRPFNSDLILAPIPVDRSPWPRKDTRWVGRREIEEWSRDGRRIKGLRGREARAWWSITAVGGGYPSRIGAAVETRARASR